MALSNAERQARWRERHRETPDPKAESDALAVANRITELEAEVHRLKRLLASRGPVRRPPSFGVPRPAPKPGH